MIIKDRIKYLDECKSRWPVISPVYSETQTLMKGSATYLSAGSGIILVSGAETGRARSKSVDVRVIGND